MTKRKLLRNDSYTEVGIGKLSEISDENTHLTNDNLQSNGDPITIKNVKFLNDFLIDKQNFKNYLFKDCEFNSISFNSMGIIEGTMSFSSCSFQKIDFISGKFQGFINFEDAECKGSLSFSGGSYEIIIFEGDCERADINDCECNFLRVGRIEGRRPTGFFHSIKISEISKIKNIVVINISCSYLTISGHFKGNEISISKVSLASLEFINFLNEGRLRIQDIERNYDSRVAKPSLVIIYGAVKAPEGFVIFESDMGRSEFQNIDLTKFEKVFIKRSLISDCIFVNLVWPNHISVEGFDTRNPNKQEQYQQRNREKNEIYKQIKYALYKRGDFVGEQHFHGREMNSLFNILSWKGNFSTKLIILLSKVTSNYGQSLFLPLLSLIIINGLLFAFFCASGNFDFFVGKNIADKVTNVIAEFIRINNPLHKNDPELTRLPFIIDMCIRIVSSYSIYNFIRATRRFVK